MKNKYIKTYWETSDNTFVGGVKQFPEILIESNSMDQLNIDLKGAIEHVLLKNKHKGVKVNKKLLLVRVLTFPFKLSFNLVWFILVAIMLSIKWAKNGGQELYYGDDFGGRLVELIESNDRLLRKLGR